MAEVALITGCATGIGRSLALNLHRRSLPQSGQPAFRVFATDYRQKAPSSPKNTLDVYYPGRLALALDSRLRTTSQCRLEMLKELKQEGIEIARLDVTDPSSIKAAVDTVISTAGRIDLLVCNAGVCTLPVLEMPCLEQSCQRYQPTPGLIHCRTPGILVTGWLVELDCAAVQRMFDINYFGVLRTVQVQTVSGDNFVHY